MVSGARPSSMRGRTCRYPPRVGLPGRPIMGHPRPRQGRSLALASLRDGLRPPLTRPGVPGRGWDDDQAGHTPGGTAMHGFVEVGTCRNDPCGQVGPLLEGGFCSDSCRRETTGCSVPGCGCGGVCDRVSRCTDCERYTWGVVDGRCPDCRPATAATVEVAPDADAWRLRVTGGSEARP